MYYEKHNGYIGEKKMHILCTMFVLMGIVLAKIVVVHTVRAADQDKRRDDNIRIDLANSAM